MCGSDYHVVIIKNHDVVVQEAFSRVVKIKDFKLTRIIINERQNVNLFINIVYLEDNFVVTISRRNNPFTALIRLITVGVAIRGYDSKWSVKLPAAGLLSDHVTLELPGIRFRLKTA